MESFPSEVRERSLAEHRRLRDAASRLAEHVRGCDCATLRAPIAEAILALLDQLRAHLEDEDASLGPLLAHVDPWGSLRAAELEARRRAQVGRLAELLERVSEPVHEGPLRVRVLEFVDWLEEELAREEREQLDPKLVRDDVVVIDAFGG